MVKAKIHLLGFFAPWEINLLYIIIMYNIIVSICYYVTYILGSVYSMQVIPLLNTKLIRNYQ